MAEIFSDDFESGDGSAWTSCAGTVTTPVPSGFGGNYYLSHDNTMTATLKTLASSKSALYGYFKFRTPSANGNYCAFFFKDSAGTVQLALTVTSNYFKLWRGNVVWDTVLATGTTTISNNTVYEVQFKFTPLNSGGVFQLKLDGSESLDIDYSGDTTKGLENVQTFAVGYEANNVIQAFGEFDDVILDDADWPSPAVPPSGPTQAQLMRHGTWFGSGVKQRMWWAK
jgi:hypothetical protein